MTVLSHSFARNWASKRRFVGVGDECSLVQERLTRTVEMPESEFAFCESWESESL
jgi:hypothetical protein